MPFDRLIRAVDAWAAREGRADVFAQIGETNERPSHIQWKSFITPQEYAQRMAEADAIIAHAGTGTIIAAARLGKPLLVMPRRADLGETRNDHQLATVRHFGERGYVLVAADENEVPAKLAQLATWRPTATVNGQASPELIARLREFVFEQSGSSQL